MTTLYSLMYKKNINDGMKERICSHNQGTSVMAAGAGEALKAEVGGKCEQVLEQSCPAGSPVFLDWRAHPHMTENTHANNLRIIHLQW